MANSPGRASTALKAIGMAALTTALVAASTVALANQRDDQRNDSYHADWGQDYGATHHVWRRGDRIGYNDWSSAPPVDYRSHHLRAPPQGYAWRESNGQYVLAAVTTGVIASIILAGGR